MTMADIIAVIGGLIIISIGFPALLMIITLIFPQPVARASSSIEKRPIRTILRGLFTFISLLIIASILLKLPLGLFKFFGLNVVLFGLSLAMLGGAGLINQLASRYQALSGSQQSAVNLFCSALFLEFATALPLVGWFVMLPVSFLLMLGAGCECLLPRAASKPQPEIIPNAVY